MSPLPIPSWCWDLDHSLKTWVYIKAGIGTTHPALNSLPGLCLRISLAAGLCCETSLPFRKVEEETPTSGHVNSDSSLQKPCHAVCLWCQNLNIPQSPHHAIVCLSVHVCLVSSTVPETFHSQLTVVLTAKPFHIEDCEFISQCVAAGSDRLESK